MVVAAAAAMRAQEAVSGSVSGGAHAALAPLAVGRALASLDRALSVEDVEVVDAQADSTLPALSPAAARALSTLADAFDTSTSTNGAPVSGMWGGAASAAARAAAEVAADHLYSTTTTSAQFGAATVSGGALLDAKDADAIARVAGAAVRAITTNGGGASGAAGAGVRALAALATPHDGSLALLVAHPTLPGVALIDASLASVNDAIALSSNAAESSAGGGGDDGVPIKINDNGVDFNSDALTFAATGFSVASILISAGGDAAGALASYALGAGIARTASRLALLLASTPTPAPPAALASATIAGLSLFCATTRAAPRVRDAGRRGDLTAAYAAALTDVAQCLLSAVSAAAQRVAPFGHGARARAAALVLTALNAGPASHDGSAGAALARALRGDDAGVRWSTALARTLDGTRAAGAARGLVNDQLIPAALVCAGAAALGGAADTRGLLAASLALPPRWATEPSGRAALFPTLLAFAAADGALIRVLADDVDVAALADSAAVDAAASETTPHALRIERRVPREARAALALTLRKIASDAAV